jgi:hypothetical protein
MTPAPEKKMAMREGAGASRWESVVRTTAGAPPRRPFSIPFQSSASEGIFA